MELEISGKNIPFPAWEKIQKSVAIFCVEVLPIKKSQSGVIHVGLIYRETLLNQKEWCLIGGRLPIESDVVNWAKQELLSAVGESLRIEQSFEIDDAILVDYSQNPNSAGPFDPRQHAVSSAFPVWCSGEGSATGVEALSFSWFEADALEPESVGFGQYSIIVRLLKSIGHSKPAKSL